MSLFKITWSTDKVEHVIQEEAQNLEAFLNIHFGSAWESAKEAGVQVEHLVGEAATAALKLLGLEPVEEPAALEVEVPNTGDAPEGLGQGEQPEQPEQHEQTEQPAEPVAEQQPVEP